MLRFVPVGSALLVLVLTGCPEPSGTPAPFGFDNTDSDAGPADTNPPSDAEDVDTDRGLSECNDSLVRQTEMLLNGEPELGFEARREGDLTATMKIIQVESDRLILQPSDGANPIDFHWRGTDLTGSFQAGDTAIPGVKGRRHSLETDRKRAVVYRGSSAFSFPVVRMGISDDDPLSATAAEPCAMGTRRGGSVQRAHAALRVQAEDDPVAIPLGETRTVDEWSITFLGATQTPGATDYIGDIPRSIEASARLRLTAVGPAME